MNKKQNRLLNAILFVVLILTIGAILFLTKSNFLKNKDEKEEEVIPNSGYKTYEVENLETLINKLSFSNKKQDFYNKSTIVNVNANITSGKVTIIIKINDKKYSYEVEGINNAICIKTNVVNTTHISYILTEDGKVYKIEDDLPSIRTTENYKGTAKDLGLTNVTNIAIDKTLKFKFNSELQTVVPCVYIKTDDNRYFTDEKIIESENIVELIEKKVEETENASEN